MPSVRSDVIVNYFLKFWHMYNLIVHRVSVPEGSSSTVMEKWEFHGNEHTGFKFSKVIFTEMDNGWKKEKKFSPPT